MFGDKNRARETTPPPTAVPNRLLASLDADACRELAVYYEQLAVLFRRQADALATRVEIRDDNRRMMAYLKTLPELVDAKIAAGMDYDEAVYRTALIAHVPCETVELYMQRRDKEREFARRKKRDLEIMRMARRGLSNADIARKLTRKRSFGKISAAHVGTIVRRQIEATHDRPAPSTSDER